MVKPGDLASIETLKVQLFPERPFHVVMQISMGVHRQDQDASTMLNTCVLDSRNNRVDVLLQRSRAAIVVENCVKPIRTLQETTRDRLKPLCDVRSCRPFQRLWNHDVLWFESGGNSHTGTAI